MRDFILHTSTFILCLLFLVACETTTETPGGVRLHLSQKQLSIITSRHLLPNDLGRRLPLTPTQRQQAQVQLGKDIPEVWVINELPAGPLAERGYNLAVRDKAESIVILPAYAMSPSEVARKIASTPPLPPAVPRPTMPLSAPAQIGSPQ